MRPLRGGIAALGAALVLGLALAAPAHAQTVNESEFNTTADEPDESYMNDSSGSSDPTLTESDLDASAPPPDESYLGDAGSSDPQLGEGDFDTSVPPADEAYLGDGEAASAGSDPGGKGVPAPALGLLLAGLALVALARRRSP